jgi:hypothetical protein
MKMLGFVYIRVAEMKIKQLYVSVFRPTLYGVGNYFVDFRNL